MCVEEDRELGWIRVRVFALWAVGEDFMRAFGLLLFHFSGHLRAR